MQGKFHGQSWTKKSMNKRLVCKLIGMKKEINVTPFGRKNNVENFAGTNNSL